MYKKYIYLFVNTNEMLSRGLLLWPLREAADYAVAYPAKWHVNKSVFFLSFVFQSLCNYQSSIEFKDQCNRWKLCLSSSTDIN